MRRQLATRFAAEGDFEIRHARNGQEAVDENRRFLPDVVTLDINMPEMDGITALAFIMADRPVPVVMVSSLTEQGALATFEALNLGAVDYVTKPGGTISLSIGEISDDLVAKVRAAARARLKGAGRAVRQLAHNTRLAKADAAAARVERARTSTRNDGVVLIGVSTGGPRTLEEILPLLAEDFPWPVLVAQHMPAAFTRPFAERLNDMCPLEVVEASHAMPLEAGRIYIGKGGADLVLCKRGTGVTVLAKPEHRDFLWHPSVELMGRSALELFSAPRIVGVMLTGMGYDGADAFAEIKKRGGRTIAESKESSIVFGMPAELIERGGASLVLPADKIAGQINLWVGR
jgi:two-component system chemotaxis response regulator CheB